jgi:glutathione S-transferase
MSKMKLTYFDAPVSRGEECRLALHLAGVDFEDHRVKRDEWPAVKATTPFGSVPVLEIPGHPPLAQSNAILVLVGRLHGLHPRDDFEAARHEAMMAHVEDMRHAVGPSGRLKDEVEKKRVRTELAAGYLPTWGANAERQITGDGPFFAGSALNVVDLKLLVAVRFLKSGVLDHVPPTILDSCPKLNRIHDAVRDDARVKAWAEKKR